MWRHIQALQARVLLLQQWVDSYVNTSVPGTVLDPESEKMRLITAEQVQRATSLDARTIDRLVAAGQFPRPLRLSPRRRAWRALQVRQWIAQQQPPPDTEPPPDTQPLLPAAPPAHSENVP
jgi:predicted DNA-binding transcriptional regulator AlpA